MKTITKLLILAALGSGLTGCIVAPYPARRAYVEPVVVVHPAYYGHYYYGR